MFKKISKFILYSLVVYAILGFFVLPYVLKSQVVEIVQKETNAKITLDKVSFNPFIFKLKLSGITLTNLENEHLFSLKSVFANFELYSLFNSAIHFKNFTLEEPKISLVLYKDKSINLTSILKEKEATQEDNTSVELPRIILDKIAIVDGSLSYEDFTQTTKFDFVFDGIGFELLDIDTKENNTSDAQMRFYSLLGDGGFIDLKSEIVTLEPLALKGSLDFQASKLYTQWRYLQDSLNLEVADGKITFYTDYSLNLEDLNATTLSNLRASLDGLRVKPKAKYKDVLNLNSLYVKDATIKPMLQEVHIPEFGLDTLYVKASRDKKGNIDWLEYIKTTESNVTKTVEDVNATAEVKEESKPWSVVVDDLAFKKIKIDFNDNAIRPSVTTNLHELNLYMQNVTLSGVEDLKFQVDIKLNKALSCSSSGSLKHKVLDLKSSNKCTGLDLLHYRPYIDKAARDALKVYNVKLVRGTVGVNADVALKKSGEEIYANVKNANLSLNKFALNKRSSAERLLTFSDFKVNGLSVDTKTKEVLIQKTSLNSVSLRTARLKNKKFNFDNLVVPKKVPSKKKSTKKQKKSKDYHVHLKHFALNNARAFFKDSALSPSVESKIDRINLNVKGIDSKKNSWLTYSFSSRVNNKGYAKSSGSVRHTPLRQVGKVELKKISLTELTPYVQESAYVNIDDGFLSLKAKTKYAQSSKRPDLTLTGSLKVDEFFTSDSRDASSIASIVDLNVRSFTYEMFPNRLYIDEVNLDAFYVNATIDKNKQMNFSKLAKENTQPKELKKEEEVTKEKDAFPITVAKVYFSNGSAFFSDFSLPLKFQTHIHTLNGVVYALSTQKGENSVVDITGAVDEYGSTKLKGAINSSNPKLFTDLSFNFKNLELSSMSGYSASFAGYKIDEGKLFLDLGYKIENSNLVGANSIVVKNIKLGDEVEGENSLPLGFVIALLEDSEGIIDIDMPVAGNVDEPDFKYGSVIWDALGNLIVKAVTSPFRFLGSMMGMDGDELEYAEFEAGSLVILPPEREKLDNVAKMFIKRPKISLSVAGTYDVDVDKFAMQREKLIDLVVKESGIENKKNHKSAMSISLLEDIYEDSKDDDKLEKIEAELEKKYKDEEFDSAYLKAVIAECIKIQVVSQKELEDLALYRAYALKDYLVTQKGINATRVKLLDIAKAEEVEDKLVKTKLSVEVK